MRLTIQDIYNQIQDSIEKLEYGDTTSEKDAYKNGKQAVKSIISTDYKKYANDIDTLGLLQKFDNNISAKINKAIFVKANYAYRKALDDCKNIITKWIEELQ